LGGLAPPARARTASGSTGDRPDRSALTRVPCDGTDRQARERTPRSTADRATPGLLVGRQGISVLFFDLAECCLRTPGGQESRSVPYSPSRNSRLVKNQRMQNGLILSLNLLLMAVPAVAEAQSCTEGTIREIIFERLDVFDSADGSAPTSFLLRAGNTLHARTAESFVRGELLLGIGDCFEPFLASESERILRSRSFIKEAIITSERLPDGSVLLRVRTQDDWSLSLSIGISFDEGFKFEGIGASENHFLGRGLYLGAIRATDRELRELGGRLGATRFLGTPMALSVASGETRVGTFVDQRLERSFLSELGKVAIRQEVSVRDDYFAYATGQPDGTTHVLLPFERAEVTLTAAFRRGDPGRLLVFGGGVSRQSLEYSAGLSDLETVFDDDFDVPLAATDADRLAIGGQTTPLAATRLNALVGFRGVSFEVRESLDGIRAVQDVKVGAEALLTVGRSIGLADQAQDANDLFARLDLFTGIAPGPLVVSTDGFLEGRRAMGDDPNAGSWRDVVGQVDGRVYWKPIERSGHTVFGRMKAAGAWSMDRPFQLTGGGREGVRGYSRDAFPGAKRLLLTLEDRSVLFTGAAADLGLVLFGDVGRVWAGDVPYGVDSGWRSSVGAGIRLSLPGGTLTATRFDFTVPISGDRERQGVYFRFYTELGALVPVLGRGGQVQRSRWSGINSNLTARPLFPG